jgi:hypothetical protein
VDTDGQQDDMATTISETESTGAPSRTTTTDRASTSLARCSVRELVMALAALEDELRGAAPLERANVARELRCVVRELRLRRDQMRALSRQGR